MLRESHNSYLRMCLQINMLSSFGTLNIKVFYFLPGQKDVVNVSRNCKCEELVALKDEI